MTKDRQRTQKDIYQRDVATSTASPTSTLSTAATSRARLLAYLTDTNLTRTAPTNAARQPHTYLEQTCHQILHFPVAQRVFSAYHETEIAAMIEDRVLGIRYSKQTENTLRCTSLFRDTRKVIKKYCLGLPENILSWIRWRLRSPGRTSRREARGEGNGCGILIKAESQSTNLPLKASAERARAHIPTEILNLMIGR